MRVPASRFSGLSLFVIPRYAIILTKSTMKPPEDGIIIKGSREGLLITLGPGAWHIALGALEARLTATPEFFKGARVALLVGTRKLVEADVRAARDLLAQHDVLLWGIIGDDEETQHVAAVMGLDAELPQRDRAEAAPAAGGAAEPIEPPIPIGRRTPPRRWNQRQLMIPKRGSSRGAHCDRDNSCGIRAASP